MISLIVLLLGVFGVPAVLLWAGHRLRRRPPRWRAMFIGALVGYAIAVVASLAASMVPPESWDASDRMRGLLGYWGLLIGPGGGALIGAARVPRSHRGAASRAR